MAASGRRPGGLLVVGRWPSLVVADQKAQDLGRCSVSQIRGSEVFTQKPLPSSSRAILAPRVAPEEAGGPWRTQTSALCRARPDLHGARPRSVAAGARTWEHAPGRRRCCPPPRRYFR